MIIAGRIVSPEGIEAGQIEINAETIVKVGENLGTADIEFGDDCLIFAGMGDIHIHARDDPSLAENYKEDFNTVNSAAINGGVVHVADMPNNPAAPIDDAFLPGAELLWVLRSCILQILPRSCIGDAKRAYLR